MPTTTTYPKITVVTPNFNQADFIEETIQSVLEQGYPNLEYIIIDGGSSDTSVDIIKRYEDQLYYWISEKDDGMYHAINKGFLESTGDIMCWINSDDVLWEGSLEYVARIFSSDKKIQWLQGFPSVIDEKGTMLYQREPVHSKYHYYFLKYEKDFSFIQQESTFWTRRLWDKAGAKIDIEYSLAADFDLWMRFFQFENLYCTKQQLGAFRKRVGQKSSDSKKYLYEARNSVTTHLKKMKFIDRMKIRFTNKNAHNNKIEPIQWVE